MRIALISDLHGNFAALETVLEALDAVSPERIVCLGDVVGYNAEPHRCIDRLRSRSLVTVMGNHDADALAPDSVAAGSRATTRRAAAWTREQLDAEDRRFLASLPNRHLDPAGLIAVHGCYLNEHHVTGYVTSTMLPDNLAAVAARPGGPRIACCGHTHVPMCGWLEDGRCSEPPPRASVRWPAAARAVLVNPGSVGQPRDGDPRAAFALIDLAARTVEFHRLPYDIEATVEANRRAGLPAELGERLREGR